MSTRHDTALDRAASPIVPVGHDWHTAALWRRGLMGFLVLVQTFAATYAMVGVLPYHGANSLEATILAVFALLFAWISVGFWMAVYGFMARRMGGDTYAPSARFAGATAADGELARTAIVFPIYHEEVERAFAGVRSTYTDLKRTGASDHFELFVLSDSRDPDIWLQEQEAWYRVCDALDAHGRIHYRRRVVNLNRKTGNLGDFLRRWGRRFRYMVVMDADSLMSGETMVRMVRLMEAAPEIGILQTSPSIVNAASAHARIQQFANRLYGPLFTTAWRPCSSAMRFTGDTMRVIRVAPFMRHCGLRRLRGRGFLSGTVLSHDFVEAAQMRRAGYEVWMDPTLCGSYEESPPTLLDELARDQRWAHGNLQHLHFLVQPDTRLAHRFAFANGIMAYVASPIWFLFLVLSTIEVARLTLWPIDYFPDRHSLFPVWPEWHPQWAIRLALSTAFLLLAPKVLAFVDVLMDRQRLRAMGGAPRVLAGVLLELVISVLLAPIRMLTHTRCVVETLLNLKVRWAGQNRTQEIGWRDAIIHHAPGGLLAAAWAGFAWWLKPLFFYWSLPVALPLVIAAPVSVWSSRFRIGAALRHAGLLVTAEQSHSPAVVEDLRGELLPPLGKLSAFEAGILDPWRNRLHACLARARRDTPGRRARRSELVGRCITSGVEALSLTERAWLAQNRLALCELHRRAWAEGPGSRCDERIEALCRGGDAAT